MEQMMTAKGSAKSRVRALPTLVEAVAFLDIHDVCSALRMSASWVHDEVRAGRFPRPMRFGPRCSRWLASDVRDYLVARAASAPSAREPSLELKVRTPRA